jgi:hypothetical protein
MPCRTLGRMLFPALIRPLGRMLGMPARRGMRFCRALVVMLLRLHAMGQPNAFGRGEHDAIEHARRGFEQADHSVGVLSVLWTTGGEAVAADERIADAQAGARCDQRAQGRFERLLPQPAIGQLGTIVL